MLQSGFQAEILGNQEGPSPVETTRIQFQGSELAVRNRGAFVVSLNLTNPNNGQTLSVLHANDNLEEPKLTASHTMSPVGPSEEIGGQHGFPRWTDYHAFPTILHPQEGLILPMQAKRSDDGNGLSKSFELKTSSLTTYTRLSNNEASPSNTSLGEHLYFCLEDERIDGLTVNGKSLDSLLDNDAQTKVMNGMPIFWSKFPGIARIAFPAGHTVDLTAVGVRDGKVSDDHVGMLIWHRKGSPSICFEPTVGFSEDGNSNGIHLNGYQTVELHTTIELV